MVKIRDMLEDLCHTIDIQNPKGQQYDSVTLEEFMKNSGAGTTAYNTACVWTRALLGCEPSELSALYFLNYCKSGGGLMQMRSDRKGGGQFLRIRKGKRFRTRPTLHILI